MNYYKRSVTQSIRRGHLQGGGRKKKFLKPKKKKNTIMQKNKHRQPRGKIKGKRKAINTAHRTGVGCEWASAAARLTSGGRGLTPARLGGGGFGGVAVSAVDDGQFHELTFLKVILSVGL